jgi:hypothetical protein
MPAFPNVLDATLAANGDSAPFKARGKISLQIVTGATMGGGVVTLKRQRTTGSATYDNVAESDDGATTHRTATVQTAGVTRNVDLPDVYYNYLVSLTGATSPSITAIYVYGDVGRPEP